MHSVHSCYWQSPPLIIHEYPSKLFVCRQDASDDCSARIFGVVQRDLGSSSGHRTYVSNCQLGNRAEEVLSGAEGVVLLRVSQASQRAPCWLDKGRLTHRFSVPRNNCMNI